MLTGPSVRLYGHGNTQAALYEGRDAGTHVMEIVLACGLFKMSLKLLVLFLFLPVRDVKPIEHQLRPKGLGLGADRSAIRDLEPGVPKRPPKPGDEKGKEEEALVLGPGGCVQVLAGAHKDLYGKVSGLYFNQIHFCDSNGEPMY